MLPGEHTPLMLKQTEKKHPVRSFRLNIFIPANNNGHEMSVFNKEFGGERPSKY